MDSLKREAVTRNTSGCGFPRFTSGSEPPVTIWLNKLKKGPWWRVLSSKLFKSLLVATAIGTPFEWRWRTNLSTPIALRKFVSFIQKKITQYKWINYQEVICMLETNWPLFHHLIYRILQVQLGALNLWWWQWQNPCVTVPCTCSLAPKCKFYHWNDQIFAESFQYRVLQYLLIK